MPFGMGSSIVEQLMRKVRRISVSQLLRSDISESFQLSNLANADSLGMNSLRYVG